MLATKKSNRLESQKRKLVEEKELDSSSKRFMICVGRKDKKAFFLETMDKRAFPASEEDLLSTPGERLQLSAGSKISLYWASDYKAKPALVSAVFFRYAESREIAQKFVNKLAVGLDKFDVQSTTLSADTEQIIDACNQDPQDEQLLSESDVEECEGDESVNNNHSQIVEQMISKRKHDAKLLHNLANQKRSSVPLTEERMTWLLCDFKASFKKELLADLTNILKSGDSTSDTGKMDQFSKIVGEKCDGIVRTMTKDFKKLNELLDPSKVSLELVQQKSCLYDDQDESPPKWMTKNFDVTPIVNNLYLKFGQKPNKFFTELVREMYGDLLCNFKLEIHRLYEDSHRTTRKPLDNFDPKGFCIINHVINQYYKKHSEEIVENKDKRSLSKDEFRSLAIKVIDTWGNKAYCKRGRNKAHIDCLLLSHLQDGFGVNEDDSGERIDEILAMYEKLKVRTELTTAKRASKGSAILRSKQIDQDQIENSLNGNDPVDVSDEYLGQY